MNLFKELPDEMPDPVHTYLGMAGLALFPLENLQPLCPELNISRRAYQIILQNTGRA